jgi:hexulose-6-phosphate isomerase
MPRISRRRFLWSTTALAATPAIGVSAGPLAGRIRIAVKYQMIQEPDLSVKQKLEMLREIGFDGVELKVDDKVDQDEMVVSVQRNRLPRSWHHQCSARRYPPFS